LRRRRSSGNWDYFGGVCIKSFQSVEAHAVVFIMTYYVHGTLFMIEQNAEQVFTHPELMNFISALDVLMKRANSAEVWVNPLLNPDSDHFRRHSHPLYI